MLQVGAASILMTLGLVGGGNSKKGRPVGRSLGQKPFHSLEDHLDASGTGGFPGAMQKRFDEVPDPGG